MVRPLVVALLPVAVLAGGCRGPRCDRLLVNGVVHLPGGPARVAIAIAEGRIVALAAPGEEGTWSADEVVDLQGAHVYAGFVEGHGHLFGYGAALEQVDLNGAASLDEVVERARAGALGLPPGRWVVGRGWDQNLWADRSFPTHAGLSRALPDRPVALRRVDGHAVLLNELAMAVAGIRRDTPDPPGGRILRDAAGEPTGVLVDAAVERLDAVLPAPAAADLERRVELASSKLASLGCTAFHDAGTGPAELATLRHLQEARRLRLRVYAMLDGSDDALLASELAQGPTLSRDGMLAVRAVKLYADGALGSRGAWLSEPYSDDPGTRGLEVTPAARLEDVVRKAAAAGFQPCIHAIGDAAVSRVLDLLGATLGSAGAALRPRLEHAQVVRPEDIPRLAALGVVASVQPTHCTSDMPWAGTRLGAARLPWAYRWRSLRAAGVPLVLGSDVPVEDPDPRRGLHAAVARRLPSMPGGEAWSPEEALTTAEAVAGFTTGAAFASFSEAWCGVIAPAFAADLTVLDRDLVGDPAGILQARVLRTVVAGRDMFVRGS